MDLLTDLERFRPGLAPDVGLQEAQAALRERAHLRLRELHRDQVDASAESPEEAGAKLQLYQREIDQILLPRYVNLALAENQEEQSQAAGRGADAFNRSAYALI